MFGTIALADEERHLIALYGKEYLDYKKSVGAVWPCTCGDVASRGRKPKLLLRRSLMLSIVRQRSVIIKFVMSLLNFFKMKTNNNNPDIILLVWIKS